MKAYHTIFILMLCMVFQGKAQGIKVVYEVIRDNSRMFPSEVLGEVPGMAQKVVSYRYSLVINEGRSRFSLDSFYIISFPDINMRTVVAISNIYKNYNDDFWLRSDGTYKEGHALQKSLFALSESKLYNWQITEEEQVIAGVRCRKAIAENGVTTAWFAPDLPYPDGPEEGDFNLPGLVLCFEPSYQKWVAVEVALYSEKIEIPEFAVLSGSENKVTLPWGEYKSLGLDKAIQLTKNTPRGQWLKFER